MSSETKESVTVMSHDQRAFRSPTGPALTSLRPAFPSSTPARPVVIGGIITSTFLTLVLLPVLYEWIEKVTNDPASND